MRLHSIIVGLLGLTLGLWLVTSQAAVYRWTGADGVVHFSQFPPQNQQATKVTQLPSSVLSPPGAATPTPSPAPAATPTQSTASPPAKQQPAPADKQACATARSNLTVLQSGRRVRVRMPDGSVHWLDKAELVKRVKETKDFLAQRCK